MELDDKILLENYVKAKGKRFIQSRIKEAIGTDFRSSILCLPGPALQDYYSVFRDFLKPSKGKRYIMKGYEIDPAIAFIQQGAQFYMLPTDQAKIQLHQGNIHKAKPERFIDLDLVQTWASLEDLIATLWKKQYTMKLEEPNQQRVFNITTALRGEKLTVLSEETEEVEEYKAVNSIVARVNDLLNTDIGIFRSNSLIDCNGKNLGKEYQTHGNSKEYSIKIFTYKDRAPMVNTLIQY